MECSISNLPFEILTEICALLGRCDLKNLRLLSRVLNNACEPVLFESIYLRVHPQSFERLRHISQHDILRRWVKTINYDGKTLDGTSARRSFELWKIHNAGTGLGERDSRARKKFIAQFSEQQLQEYYQKYCQYLDLQDSVLKIDMAGLISVNKAEKMLANAIKNFPNITTVQYTAKSDATGQEPLTSVQLRSLNPLAQTVLAGLESFVCQCWPLFHAIHSSGHTTYLKQFCGSDIHRKTWQTPTWRCECADKTMPALEKLSLDFCPEQGPNDHLVVNLSELLRHTPALKLLRLSFNCPEEYGYEAYPAPPVVSDQLHLEYLNHLSLQGMDTSEKHLTNLLKNHTKTLRSLQLSNMRFMTIENDAEDPERNTHLPKRVLD